MLKHRSLIISIVLSFVTFGIYPLFWMCGMANEFARANNKPPQAFKLIFLSIITFGIYFLYWNYKMGKEISNVGGRDEGLLYLLLSVFGLFLVSLALMQIQENSLVVK